MDQEYLLRLKIWFTDYCRSFDTSDAEDQENLSLKEKHTHEVCANAAGIAGDLGLDQHRTFLAEVAGLFHDVGRFPQYHQYRTFSDNRSVNHAALGAKVLLENNVLNDLPKRERELIIHVVALHNVFSLPENLDHETLLLVKLVRDADKLDIMRIMIEHSRSLRDKRSVIVGLGLPDTPSYSPVVLKCLAAGEMVHLTDLRFLNDFKLLQLAWIYDLNFAGSLRIVEERDAIRSIAKTLPDTDEIRSAVDAVAVYLFRKLHGEPSSKP